MATVITPVRSIPTTSGDISGSFTAGGTSIRMCGALTAAGQDNLVLIRQQPSGYWEKTSHELRLSRQPNDFLDASGSVEVQILQLGRGHTKGDTVVWLPGERTLLSGDLVEYDATPYAGDECTMPVPCSSVTYSPRKTGETRS